MSGFRIEYRPFESALPLGGGRRLYGAYAVILVDGFVFLSPHVALPGTTSELPIDVSRNPEFVETLVTSALAASEVSGSD